MMSPKQIILCKICQLAIEHHSDGVVWFNDEDHEFIVAHRNCLFEKFLPDHWFDLIDFFRGPEFFRKILNCEIMNGNLEQEHVRYLLWQIYEDYDEKVYFLFGEEDYQAFFRRLNKCADR